MNGPWICTNCDDLWGSGDGKPIETFCHLCANKNKKIIGKNVIWGQCSECGHISMADVQIADRDGEDRITKVCWKCGYSDHETNAFAEEFEI